VSRIEENPVVKQSLDLLQRLLSPTRTRTNLISGRPIATAAEAGALAVVGMKTESPRTWVSVFIYRTFNEATEGVRTIEAASGSKEGKCIISAVNGRMVLYGWGTSEGDTAPFTRYALNHILAAFDED
jgi:hypothetical protein